MAANISHAVLRYQKTEQIHDRCMICFDEDNKTNMVAHPIIQSRTGELKSQLGCYAHVECLSNWIATSKRVYRTSITCSLCLQPVYYDHIQEIIPNPGVVRSETLENREIREYLPYQLCSKEIQKLLYVFKRVSFEEDCLRLSEKGYNIELIRNDLDLLLTTIANHSEKWKNPNDQQTAVSLYERLIYLYIDLESKNDDFSRLLNREITQDPSYEFHLISASKFRSVKNEFINRLNNRWYWLRFIGYKPNEVLKQIEEFDLVEKNSFYINDKKDAEYFGNLYVKLNQILPDYTSPIHLTLGFGAIVGVSMVAFSVLTRHKSDQAESESYQHRLG